MLYLTQRYFLGMMSLGFLIMAGIIFLPVFQPETFPNLLDPETFVPMMDLFILSGAIVTILAIASTHPLVTDGKETLYMTTPMSHPGIHANILVGLILGGMYYYMTQQIIDDSWQMERRIESCIFLLQTCAISTAYVTVSFYIIKSRAREKTKLRRLDRELRKQKSRHHQTAAF